MALLTETEVTPTREMALNFVVERLLYRWKALTAMPSTLQFQTKQRKVQEKGN